VNILLDTHTLLWAIGQSDELSKKVIKEIENTDNDIFVSAVSLWEIALKSKDLPFKASHKDPFDRLLIYISIKYGYVLASKDNNMKFYKNSGLVALW
jgi:PIN domain nuclease of toxin-antitoxin system